MRWDTNSRTLSLAHDRYESDSLEAPVTDQPDVELTVPIPELAAAIDVGDEKLAIECPNKTKIPRHSPFGS
jgi:hypothetical protein